MAIINGDVRAALLELSGTEIDALFGTPVTIIPAQGAGLVAVPLMVTTRLIRGTVAYNASRALQVQYSGDTTNLINTLTILLANSPGGTLDQVFHAARVTSYSGANNFNPSNRLVQVTWQTGDVTGGSAGDRFLLNMLYEVVSAAALGY